MAVLPCYVVSSDICDKLCLNCLVSYNLKRALSINLYYIGGVDKLFRGYPYEAFILWTKTHLTIKSCEPLKMRFLRLTWLDRMDVLDITYWNPC